jgi:hypothetical protein
MCVGLALGAPPDAAEDQPTETPELSMSVSHSDGIEPNFSLSSEAHVPAGYVHHGELVAVFGDVVIEGTVTGEVVVVLGSLQISGTVESDVVSVLSKTKLFETARVEGEMVNVGWSLDREPGSKVDGELVNVNFMSLIPFAGDGGGWTGLLRIIYLIRLAKLAALFVVVLLIAALLPRRVAVIGGAFPVRWAWSILVGLLAWAVFFIGCFILAVTLIGIPLVIALGFAMLVTKWLGFASIFFLVGQTLGRNLFRRELPHISCVLGGFIAYALLSLIPFVGWGLTLAMNVLAVGLVISTRFGSEEPWGKSSAPVAGSAPAPEPAAGPPAPPSSPEPEPPGASPSGT